MRVLVFIDQFERGGAARVTCTMLNGLISEGYEIVLATNIISASIDYPLDSNIKVVNFYGGETHNKIQSVKRHIKLIISARECINLIHPKVIVAVTHNPYFYVRIASWFLKTPLIAVDHTSFSRKISRREDWIRHHFYKYADVLSILTEKDRRLLGEKFPNKVVVYNPLSFPPLDIEEKREKNILVAGRLSYWHVKGVDRIIKIWGNLSKKYPDWTLEIAGDGDDKSIQYLKTLINENDLESNVRLVGQIKDMRQKLSHTSIFALPSRVEGFPMVLMEAMSQGCSCVAFSIGGATNEMMTNHESGTIVKDNDVESFSKALEHYLNDSNLRSRHGKNAINESKRFSPQAFIETWKKILNKFE